MSYRDEPPDLRYHIAAQVACQIINTVDMTGCKADAFSKVVYLILEAMYEAEMRIEEWRLNPSEN